VAAQFYARARLAPIGLYHARNITLGDGLLMRAGGQLLGPVEINIETRHVRGAVAKFGLPDPAAPGRRLTGSHALIVGPGYHIYGHWMAEILPRLSLLQAGGCDLDGLKFLVPHDIPTFAIEMFRLLGFAEAQFVVFGGAAGDVLVEELLLPGFPHNGVRYTDMLRDTVALWRERVEARHGALSQSNYPRRLFLARRGSNRALADRKLVEESFAAAGFKIMRPETLPLLEQWRMFAGATEIAGEYGSALHGSLFSPAGTVVCALRGAAFHPAFIQSGIGEVLAQPTGYIFGTNIDDATYGFSVSQHDVKACMDAIFCPGAPSVSAVPAASLASAAMTAADFVALHDRLVTEGKPGAARKAIRNALALEPGFPGAAARLAAVVALIAEKK
jgi:capsular polysaccharide biosynthesis protein